MIIVAILLGITLSILIYILIKGTIDLKIYKSFDGKTIRVLGSYYDLSGTKIIIFSSSSMIQSLPEKIFNKFYKEL